MKKVSIIMACGLPVPAVKGGAVATLVESLLRINENERKVMFDVFTLGDEESEKKSKDFLYTSFLNIHYNTFIKFIDKYFFKRKKYFGKLYVIYKARRYLKQNDFDAVVLQNGGYLLKIFRDKKLLKKYRGRIFFHLHNDIPQNVDKLVIKYCNFILISNYLKGKVIELCGNSAKAKCIIVKNGINIHKFNQALPDNEKNLMRRKFDISSEQKILVFVGRINPQKGIDKLLQAMKKLDNINLVLLVIGSTNFGSKDCSPFETAIKRECDSMKSTVRFIGFIHNDELWKYYQLADVAVLPSMWEEPAGLTMIEAVASGTPVVSTLSGGIPEYLSPNCGILVKRDSEIIQSLADAIRIVLQNNRVWGKRIIIGKNEICNLYSEEAFYHRFINSIDKT